MFFLCLSLPSSPSHNTRTLRCSQRALCVPNPLSHASHVTSLVLSGWGIHMLPCVSQLMTPYHLCRASGTLLPVTHSTHSTHTHTRHSTHGRTSGPWSDTWAHITAACVTHVAQWRPSASHQSPYLFVAGVLYMRHWYGLAYHTVHRARVWDLHMQRTTAHTATE